MARFEIDEVLAKSPLDEVARRLGLDTERRGNQLSAICPFHQDTRPSLRFFPADSGSPEHFHCFACGAHGHAIDLVKQAQGVDFLPAVQWLSHTFGIKLNRHQATNQANSNKDIVDVARAFALKIFKKHHDTQKFKAWCQERAFEVDFLYQHGVRCITHSVFLQELALISPGERVELVDGLLSLGLLKRLQQSSHPDQYKLSLPEQFQDYFHDGRVLIPIYSGNDKRPELVGFAGRSLQTVPPEGVPKYLLTPGFQKAKYLFNAPSALSNAKIELKDKDSSTLYIVEGFLDALRLKTLGLNAVALMGTSLSDGQFESLKEFIDSLPQSKANFEIIIFLDNDKAGFSGADKLVRRLLGLPGIDLRWIGLDDRTNPPLAKDPDTCLKTHSGQGEALKWILDFKRPAEAVLLVSELGDVDASSLLNERWSALNSNIRERILFKSARAIRQVSGSRPLTFVMDRLKTAEEFWAAELGALLDVDQVTDQHRNSELFLQGFEERLFHARNLAYHGSRRGELPCDEESWLTLDVSSRLFDRIAQQRLKTREWRQAASYDAVHLPRKLTANSEVLDDPRRKVMPHPADLHLQQVLMNELLTQRHDLLSAEGKTFSAWIPAVRWYSGTRKVEVTSQHDELLAREGEEPTLSFGYQVDMDVLEGIRTPSDQGMFRPFGQCWRDFMGSLSRQSHSIGGRVHVLRLDAQRYYDSIQRYVVRDALLDPIRGALAGVGVETFGSLLGLDELGSTDDVAEELVNRVCNFLFGHQYRHPNTGTEDYSQDAIGIPQGPVLSAYIGTIALFPVDLAARRFMRQNVRLGLEGVDVPRVGYARYVDDIVLFADSEELLSDLREVLHAEAAKWSITLINKGHRVRSGSAELVMCQLNEGRSFAASVPAWEPPFVGDGEAGWGLGGDMPAVDRQCALRMLRHPTLMDEPDAIQEHIRQAIQAPDLRPNDLGLCARWLWWKVATELFAETLQNTPAAVWERYWILWRFVCDGQVWSDEFEQRGYTHLYAVEGLDKLLDPNPWMETDQTHNELPKKRATRIKLATLVTSNDFFLGIQPSENKVHVQWRARLVAGKARHLSGRLSGKLLTPQQMTPSVTSIEWLCMAAEQIRAHTISTATNDSSIPLLAAIKQRNIRGGNDLARDVCEVLKIADAQNDDPTTAVPNSPSNEADQLALGLVIENASPADRMTVLAKFPGLLSALSCAQLSLIQRLPITEVTSLWAVGKSTQGDQYLYRFSTPTLPLSDKSRDLVSVELTDDDVPVATVEPWEFNADLFDSKLMQEKSKSPISWSKFDVTSIPNLRLTALAVSLYNAVIAMQNVRNEDPNLMYVPFEPQLFCSGDKSQLTLHLVAEPVRRQSLGVSAWYRDGDGRIRTASVPHTGADLWRAGWAVADALGMAVDMSGEIGLRDEQLPENVEISVEHYLLRQQLRKLQGVYLSEAKTWREDRQTGLPRTVQRALQLLSEFNGNAKADQQVQQLLIMEAETRAMALRIQQSGSEDLRGLLHQVFPSVLNKLPLWVIDQLKLPEISDKENWFRPDLKVMLSLCEAMEGHWKNTSHQTAATALQAALALATITAGLRGSVGAVWGLTQDRSARRMSERLDLPVTFVFPDMARTDPQSDYAAMRQWMIEGDWPALCRASPWHWMLALTGLLNASFPFAFELPEIHQVFAGLAAWHGESSAEDNAIWPYDGLPVFDPQRWTQLLLATRTLVVKLDEKLGMRVITCMAPRFLRNPHTDEFTDAANQGWLLGKQQFSGLGAEDRIARHSNLGRILSVWSETRRESDNHLLAVHTLDRKLGAWLENAAPPEAVSKEISFSIEDTTARSKITQARDDQELHTTPKTASGTHSSDSDSLKIYNLNDLELGSTDNETTQPTNPELTHSDEEVDQKTLSHSINTNSGITTGDIQNVALLPDMLTASQKLSRASRADVKKSRAHFRVALFQWEVDDTYAHPLSEVGLKGFPISESAKVELRAMLGADSDLLRADKAAKHGQEHNWTDSVKIISWVEHRRRTLIRVALNACKDLGVELLVLPEVSVRPDTIEWLEAELKDFEGLAVLAGTYRNFSEIEDSKHLQAPLTLLWRPKAEMAKSLGLEKANKTFLFERGKKYRAVAANEFFRPNLDVLSPLYTEEKLISKVVEELSLQGITSIELNELPGLAHALVHLSPPLRYCMELICSELFLLTSPANYEPLIGEMKALLQRFKLSTMDVEDCVPHDVAAIGQLLTVTQSKTYRERRSVLLVPSFTSRSNDYWHAGQASVLASGTATVFCNAVHQASIGGSCFIGINSVSHSRASNIPGVVGCLTPYHGWQKGILQANSEGALSGKDQALVVVDIDPVNVVSGKPRPQLLPEPMSLVAYLPVVELLDKDQSAAVAAGSLELEISKEDQAKKLLQNMRGHERLNFYNAFKNLFDKRFDGLSKASVAKELDDFVKFFGDPIAMRERFFAWENERHQQPSFIEGSLKLEPAWLDFLIADLTCLGQVPKVKVPPWKAES